MRELTVGDVSRRSGVAVSALHFYETKGLIASHRTAGNQRRYRQDVLRRVAVIRVAQEVGISLAEVGRALAALPTDHAPTRADWAAISERWAKDLDRRIAQFGLGPGGAIGRLIGGAALDAGAGLIGRPTGDLVVWALLAALGATLTVLALGLSRGEWRAAGQAIGSGLRHGRRTAGFCGRIAAHVGGAGVALLERLNGSHAGEAPRVIAPGRAS